MPLRTLLVGVAAPFASLFVFWGFLAMRRAQETDPLRPRREARTRLQRTLARLAQASDAERPGLLLAWQRDAAVLWQVIHAAPPASALGSSEWSVLWSEADRALYGMKASLPSDWLPRAQAALEAKTVPSFQPLRLFLRRNLMPFAALLAAAFLGTNLWLQAAATKDEDSPALPADGLAAYRKGDFAIAEKAWRRAVEQAPTDWIVRHNLSLALEQQEHSGDAAAQAAAAFVQNPSHPAVRWHFVHTAGKLGAAPPTLARFATGSALHSLAQSASPAQWQWAIIASAWGAALAVGAFLFSSYRGCPAWIKWSGLVLLGASVSLATVAGSAFGAYGLCANMDAAIVARAGILRSIPTEADTTQKTTSLPAGSLALVDKTFLGWRRLAFENGQTGWVRKEDLVPIWK
jgi:tetratricopeptide (TPR) repeat protein